MDCCETITQFFDDIHSMAQSLRVIAASLVPSTPANDGAYGVITVAFPQLFSEGINMNTVVQAGREGEVKVRWVDEYGNAARVDGDTRWQSSDEKIATVTAMRPDTTHAHVKSLGPIGPVQIQATVDGDMGNGRETITAVLDLSVIAGQASGGDIGPADDDAYPDNTLPGQGGGGGGNRPDNTLPGVPGAPVRPDNTLPGVPGAPVRPDNTLPGHAGTRPDNTLPGVPGAPARPDNTLPGHAGTRPDNTLPGVPGAPARPDNTLPGHAGTRPDNTLPAAPEPKARVLGGRRK